MREEDLPIEDDLDAEEESPYRRRSKAVAVRRGRWGGVRRALRWGGLLLFVLIPAGYAGYRLVLYGVTSARFTLFSPDDVIVRGNRYVSRGEVLNVLGISRSGQVIARYNMFRFPLEEKRRLVESIPWVRTASLARGFPRRLVVELVERTPVAFVNVDGNVKLVDDAGVILEKPSEGEFAFPILTGLEAVAEPEERHARLALYQQFARELAEMTPASGWVISEVNVGDADNLKAILVRRRESILVHFGHGDFRERFANFLALLPEVRRAHARIDSIDLRYRNQVVVNPGKETSRDTAQTGGGRGAHP
jgi:cell division septal protein FtsQ